MANLVNVWAETGANIIGDDAQPTLTLSNSSTGAGLEVRGLAVVSGASLSGTLSGQINLSGGILAGNATITGLNIVGASVASGPAIALKGDAFVSAISLIFAAGAGWAGMGAIRVVRTDGTFGWIPVLPAAQVTPAVI